MTRINTKYLLITLLLSIFCQVSLAQFQTIPLKSEEKIKPSSAKIMALSLPFFDDFSTSVNRQDFSKWQKGGGVFINNTFITISRIYIELFYTCMISPPNITMIATRSTTRSTIADATTT